MKYFLLNILLPCLVSVLLFLMGKYTGKLEKLRAIGEYPYWAITIILSWGWFFSIWLWLPDWFAYSWLFPTLLLGASGLFAGILFMMRRQRKWFSLIPTAGVFCYLLLCFCSACCFVRVPEEPSGPHFSVLTYNINWGGGRKPELSANAILKANADIICLQETTPAWENYLKGFLQETYPYCMFRHSGGAGGIAVLSKKPLKQVAYVPSKAGWFPGWVVQADTPLGLVQILCVHLRPPLGERGGFSLGAYMSIKGIHRKEIEDFNTQLMPDVPTIVLGDFNEGGSGSAVKWLKAKGMTDALPEFDAFTKTWRWNTRLVTLSARFDHILYSKHLHCLEARVLEEGSSDHFPVMAVFENRHGQAVPQPVDENKPEESPERDK